MRFVVTLLLAAALVACSGAGPVGSVAPAAVSARHIVQPAQVIDPLAGVSAHYVVEMGENADSDLQVDVRQIQEPSIFAKPEAFGSAAIVYPDGSMQRVDADGSFDAAASSYAVKHAQSIGDPGVVVHVVSPLGIAYQPTAFRIYVPSKAEERRESSVAAAAAYNAVGNILPSECKRSAPHGAVVPDDLAPFVFTTKELLGISFTVALGSCTTANALGEVADYEWVSGSGEYRYTIRYHAPSRKKLKANGVTAVGEYLDVPTTSANLSQLSPRYDVTCAGNGSGC
jgi:hypothetical protein